MSKPRPRWATRDSGQAIGFKAGHRRRLFWTRKPSESTLGAAHYGGVYYVGQINETHSGWKGTMWKASRADFIERFGRDLAPGERRRLK